jgi:hypothetical protein
LPPGKRYLSIFYPDDSDGQLFEIDDRFVFHGDAGETGNFENFDATFEWLNTDDKDVYRWNYEPRNHEREDDFTHILKLLEVMNKTPDEQYEKAMAQIVNVDEWLRVMAVRTIISDWDFFGGSRGKNAYLYRPNKTGKWEILSWDSELTFQQPDMWIWSNFPAIRRFQESPKHQHLYLSYIREILDKYFNPAHLLPWIGHYHEVIGGTSPEAMVSFIEARTDYLNGIIPEAEPKITGAKLAKDGKTIELKGTAPVQTRSVRISGVEYELEWLNATEWKLTLPRAKGKNLTVEFLDYDKQPVGKDSIRVE